MRRTGIAFETVLPPLPDTLPRMDVAAFVGFARSGPVDVPVAVEDMSRFRDLFGNDQPLAWDGERGAIQYAQLGAAVDAFFGGGGRRCWIVRVAQSPYTHRFPLPGVLQTHGGASIELRRLQARAPGSWAQDLRVGATLTPRSLATLPASRSGPAVDPSGAPTVLLSIDLAGAPGTVQCGDLLELRFLPLDFSLFLVATSVIAIDRGLRIGCARNALAPQWAASAARWAWAVPVGASPPSDHPPQRYPDLLLLDELAGQARLAAWRALPEPSRTLQVRRLTFELSAWHDGRLAQRLGELAFCPAHPRFFGNLPTDEQLFAATPSLRPDGRDVELAALRAEASGERDRSASVAGQRFAFAGPAYPDLVTDWPLFLPSRMDLGRNAEQTEPALDLGDVPPAREQDGVAELARTPFFDPRLQDYSGESLLTTAQALHDAAREWDARPTATSPQRLRGLHAVLPCDEATLLAIPDAAHRAWSLSAPAAHGLLAAPDPLVLGSFDEAGRLGVTWSPVAGATGYELQLDETPGFDAAVTAYQGEASSARVVLPTSCAPQRYFRVRALNLAQPSPWSGTRVLGAASGSFVPCGQDELPELVLAAGPAASGGKVRLTWAARAGGALSSTLRYRVELAYNALMDTPEVHDVPAGSSALEVTPRGALRYCRVRAALDAGPGPWSNTVVLPPGDLAQPALQARPARGGTYDDTLLLAVHRAAVRLCAARGDLFALLTLPGHYGRQEVVDHLAALTPDETAEDTQWRDQAMRGRLRLSQGEASALSHAALYHPWVALARPGGAPEFQPPDGVAAGALARAALERGAWTSCANRPLPGALALAPALTDADADALLDLQVNLLRRTPRGFVLADDQTLAREGELRETGVRRLLILLRRLALREGNAYVFEPMVAEFPDRVRHRFERMLSTLHLRGAFSGQDADDAFRVVTDASVNPPQSLDLGRFVVELRVAPSRPLSFLRVRLVQRGPQELQVGEV
jgi:hypothetical protein